MQYIYNQLGQLTNATERIGSDAGTGYAMLGNGNGKMMAGTAPHPMRAAVLATLGKIPTLAWSGMAAAATCALAFSLIPPRKRRRLLCCVAEAWRAQLRILSPAGGERESAFSALLGLLWLSQPPSTPRRLRLPSLLWRCVTLLTLICLIGSDPSLESLWNARAACGDVPASTGSTETVRITTFSYDLEGAWPR